MGEGKRAKASVVHKPETRDLLRYYLYQLLQSKADSGSAKACDFSREFTVVSACCEHRGEQIAGFEVVSDREESPA